MILKEAKIHKWKLLLDWRNDLATRNNSHNQHLITEENHKAWLQGVIDNPNRKLFIAYQDEKPIGTMRADLDESTNVHELSWTVAPSARGKGYGKRMVQLLANKVGGKIRAEIKEGNYSSIKIAEYAGMYFEQKKDGFLYFSNFE